MEDPFSVSGVLDTAAWARYWYNRTNSRRKSLNQSKDTSLRRADKNRIQGKIQIHEYLKVTDRTVRPKLQIFNTCPNLIKELQSIPLWINVTLKM